jgi:hypothetical protein
MLKSLHKWDMDVPIQYSKACKNGVFTLAPSPSFKLGSCEAEAEQPCATLAAQFDWPGASRTFSQNP